MKKYGQLFLAGLSPLAAGFLLDRALRFLPVPLLFVSLLLTLIWGWMSYRVSRAEKSALPQAAALCLPGALMLALVLYQELVAGEYWVNGIGFASQMYFLPALPLVSAIVTPLMKTVTLWPLYIVCWLYMVGVSWLASFLKHLKYHSTGKEA